MKNVFVKIGKILLREDLLFYLRRRIRGIHMVC